MSNPSLILTVTSGPASGRTVTVESGQSFSIGRTDRAAVAMPEDPALSGVHFRAEFEGESATIEDLGSRNGTIVNGRRIAQPTAVFDGDEIHAGQSMFAVRIVGAPSSSRPVAAPPVADRSAPRTSYTLETCDTGLALCRGDLGEIQPAELALRLGGAVPAHLIVDFHHLGAKPPPGLSARNYLFDWLEPIAAEATSPLVISQDELPDWPALVQQAWGSNAVVCFFSRQEKTSLLSHLRGACRGRSAGAEGLLGWCWPSVLALMLANGAPATVQTLLSGIDAVLVELPDLPQTWQLFGPPQITETLDRLGFVRDGN
jgi:hypothetical protein